MSDRNNYSIALTHAFLAGTSIWVLYRTNGLHYASGSFGVICANSLVGLWKYGNPEHGNKLDGVYDVTNICATLFSLPGVCVDMYLHYGFEWIYAFIHIAVPLIPAIMYIIDEDVDQSLIDFSNVGNAISMGALSYNYNNYFGIYAAISHFVNQFVLIKKEVRDVPKEVLYNLGMCFYTYFAYRALVECFVRIH